MLIALRIYRKEMSIYYTGLKSNWVSTLIASLTTCPSDKNEVHTEKNDGKLGTLSSSKLKKTTIRETKKSMHDKYELKLYSLNPFFHRAL